MTVACFVAGHQQCEMTWASTSGTEIQRVKPAAARRFIYQRRLTLPASTNAD